MPEIEVVFIVTIGDGTAFDDYRYRLSIWAGCGSVYRLVGLW